MLNAQVLLGLVVFLVAYRLKMGHHWGADADEVAAAARVARGEAPPSLTPGRALTAEEIERYSTKAEFVPPAIAPEDGEEETCSVCICEFEAGETLRTLRCGHVYHAECIDEWLLGLSVLCPMCKQDVRRGRRLSGVGDELAVAAAAAQAAAAAAAAAAEEEGAADAAAQRAERGADEGGGEDEAARPANVGHLHPHRPAGGGPGRGLQREFSEIEGVEGIEMAHIRRLDTSSVDALDSLDALDLEASVGRDDVFCRRIDGMGAEREAVGGGEGRRRGGDGVSVSSLSGLSRDDESSSDGEHRLSPLNFPDPVDSHSGAIGVVVGESIVNPASLMHRGEGGGGGGGGEHGVDGGLRRASLRHEVRNPMVVNVEEEAAPTSGGGRSSHTPSPDISSVTRRV